MYKLQETLKNKAKSSQFSFSTENDDGRINSCIDEDHIIQILVDKFGSRIQKPKIRMWYDLIAYDYQCGWIPINIKTTTTVTSDNTGNLAMCVHAYTNEHLDVSIEKSYANIKMSILLLINSKKKEYNTCCKKDYYFLVMNKNDATDVIVNSVKGLTNLTPNINNLPFQVCWSKNRNYSYSPIKDKVKLFIDCLQRPKPSWKETFMSNIRSLDNLTL